MKSNSNAENFGPTKSIDPWSETPIYTGTPAQFIASGLLTQEQIPNEPGCPKVRVFRFGNPEDRRDYKVTLCPKSRLIRLSVCRPNADDRARIREKELVQEARHRFAHAKMEESRDLNWMPVSRQDFAARMVRYIRGRIELPKDVLAFFANSGYSFDQASIDALDEAITEAFEEFTETYRVTYRTELRRQYIATVKAKTAQADPAFTSMMAVIVAGRPPADGVQP